MSLASISIRRPVLAIVMSAVIILFGIIGYSFLGVREFPSIDPPIITVRTSYAGANADIIESQITEPLEKVINGIEGIRSISSSSNQGSSIITVEFKLGADLETAANDVRDKVSQAVRQLPQDIDGLPTVTKADANSDAILSLTIESDKRSQLEISDYAENVIAQRLQTIPGVSTVQIWGQKRYAMRIWIDPKRMQAVGVTPVELKAALDKENVELPSGKLSGAATDLSVRTISRLTEEEEFNNLVIRSDSNRTVRLRDIGYATLGPENEETMLKQSGIPMIGLGVVPQPGANYIDIADEFYKRVDQIKKDLPGDYKLGIALDNTRFIRKSILEVQETLIIAIVLVVLIIYIFFRNWRIAFRPLIDLPVSLIGAFFIMYLLGFSINVLTLLAIVLATGLVVDDGIVVTENIYKKIEGGMAPMEAAFKGSKEIMFAVISTSITLAVVFMPLVFMEGFVGHLFREFGIVIAGAVLISAFVSLSLTPMLNARLITSTRHSKFYEATEPYFERLNNAYRNSLRGFLNNRWLAFPIIALTAFFIWFTGSSLQSELAPLEDRSLLRLSVTAQEGASFEYTDNLMDKLATLVNDSIPEKKIFLTVTAPGFSGSGAVNTGFGRLVLSDPSERDRSQQEIADQVTRLSRHVPEGRVFVIQEQTISSGGGPRVGLPVQFVLQATDFEKLKGALPKFLEMANKHPVFQGVDVNLKFNRPEVKITIDREKARALGVYASDIAQSLQLSLSGQRYGYFTMQGKQYQVIAQLEKENRNTPTDLTDLFVRSKSGQLISLDNLVKMEEIASPPQLYHYNRYQSATVSAGLAPGKTIGDGIDAMREIAAQTLDESFSTDLTGASRDYEESSSNLLFAFILALILMYLVLSAQFESFTDPFIIMLTVPLALAGAVVSLWYFNQTLNIFSQIGMIMLIGLVTKNGILIVEFANQLREQGKDKFEAVLEGSVLRLRPILMTSLATALGALPIALALGAGSKSRMPLGIVIVGGVIISLLLTLYVIPAMYSYLARKKREEIITGEE